MRLTKIVAPVLAVVGLGMTGAAMADFPPLEAQLLDFYEVNRGPFAETLAIVPSADAVGRPCTIFAQGFIPVGVVILTPGVNTVMVPQTYATSYLADGPTIEGKILFPGIN
jgi:hypothetical protein